MKKAFVSILANLVLISTLVGASAAQAKIEVLFHPTDPTLEKVGAWIKDAHDTIDIAMYSMDTTAGSPVVKALMDPAFQARLKSGDVTIRMIFEGYGKPADNEKKMQDLEALGIDVRFLKSGKKVHHKFAVIDSGTANARVISGSANWSLSSYRGYDENMLFMEQEAEANHSFETEFERLWNDGAEFGNTVTHAKRALPQLDATDRMDIFFNSPRVLHKDPAPEHVLTSQLVRLIDGAKSEISIATTRVRLVPVLESLKAAAARGVKVRVVISQDDFRDLWKRGDYLLNQPNLELRIKFYNLKPGQYITYQMHNKFMIIDRETIETGSFNWSDSSETAHVENVLELKGAGASEVLSSYQDRFELIWERGRADLAPFMAALSQKKQAGELPACGFSPMSLSYDEVRALLKLAPKCGSAQAPSEEPSDEG
jgi:phosphatidylserine/phosphatidylglycerophosphate/cardiolipin synthase-like enzyme